MNEQDKTTLNKMVVEYTQLRLQMEDKKRQHDVECSKNYRAAILSNNEQKSVLTKAANNTENEIEAMQKERNAKHAAIEQFIADAYKRRMNEIKDRQRELAEMKKPFNEAYQKATMEFQNGIAPLDTEDAALTIELKRFDNAFNPNHQFSNNPTNFCYNILTAEYNAQMEERKALLLSNGIK